jgi:hypothetical protein
LRDLSITLLESAKEILESENAKLRAALAKVMK